MAARVGGKKKYPGTAVITVSLASEDRYSICDYEASFTLATPSVSRRGGGAEDGDDTDVELEDSASKSSIRRFVITEKAPTRTFSWLKAATTAFTFKTLLRHYAKRALTPRSLNVKLGPRRKGHKGRAVWLA